MGSGNDSILDTYLYETNTLLEQLDGIVLAAEQADTFSQNDVDEIFRIMHTIKGSSAMMEFNPLMTVAHRIEDLFFIIREKGMDVVQEENRPALFDLVFQAVDYFRGQIERVENNEPLSEDIDSFLKKINSLISKIKGEPQEVLPVEAEKEPEPSAGKQEGEFPYGLQIFFDEGCGMENLRAFMLVSAVRDFCADADFSYSPEDVEQRPELAETIIENGFLMTFKSAADRDKAIHVVTGSGSVQTYQTINPQAASPDKTSAAQPQNPEPAAGAKAEQTERAKPAAPATPAAPAGNTIPASGQHAARESLISVNLSKLDQLMAVVGEIVITESMVTSSPDLKDLKLDSFTKSARQLRKLTDELQDVSMSLRMVPVSGTFQKMNRIVRDMGKKLGKRVKLTLKGEDTEVDKAIVDSIGDPIMHIVRNSMDHGIEEREEDRVAAGKDPVGEIVLAARNTGSEVVIEIKDDGQGVNYDAVLAKARRVGLAAPDAEYSNREILNFLLMPGFSTNSEVTEFSGRGVGMDVVKKNVEEVGGSVSISSQPGQGMTTTLKIPLTMAIMDGMEVSVGGSIFTIPIHNIRQVLKVTAGEVIHDASQGELIKCMEHFYPIVRLRNIYGLDEGYEDIEKGILLWVESGDCSYCLLVDELIGEQQVVVKPLPPYVTSFSVKNYGITGCTILGDGNISIILDIANLCAAVR